jgi:hypothetical protein
MKVLEHTESRLRFQTLGMNGVSFVLLMFGVGIVMLIVRLLGGGSWIVSGLLLLAGCLLAAALTLERTTCILDRTTGKLTIDTTSRLDSDQLTLRLEEIIGADVERRFHRKGGTSYRARLVLRSGGHLPVQPYFNLGVSEEAEIARHIREFIFAEEPLVRRLPSSDTAFTSLPPADQYQSRQPNEHG